MSKQNEIILPIGLNIVFANLPGCIYEIKPRLLKECSQEDLNILSENLMCVVGDHYLIENSGSAVWLLYKRLCEKNIHSFLKCVQKDNHKTTLEWLIENYKHPDFETVYNQK
jgi:hypothetical protein